MLRFLLITCILFSTNVLAENTTPKLGIAFFYSGKELCASFHDGELTVGQVIYYSGFNSPRWYKGKVVERKSERCDNEKGYNKLIYEIHLDNHTGDSIEVGVFIVYAGEKLSVKNRRPVITVDANSQPIILRECTSNEGAHQTAWQGKRRIWRNYFYAGYDIDPTCTKAETRD